MKLSDAKRQLDEISHDTFEAAYTSHIFSIKAASPARNEIQFRLSSNIARLRADEESDVYKAVLSDIHLCFTMGWLPEASYKRAINIMEELV